MDQAKLWLMLTLPHLELVEMHISMMMSFSLSIHQVLNVICLLLFFFSFVH